MATTKRRKGVITIQQRAARSSEGKYQFLLPSHSAGLWNRSHTTSKPTLLSKAICSDFSLRFNWKNGRVAFREYRSDILRHAWACLSGQFILHNRSFQLWHKRWNEYLKQFIFISFFFFMRPEETWKFLGVFFGDDFVNFGTLLEIILIRNLVCEYLRRNIWYWLKCHIEVTNREFEPEPESENFACLTSNILSLSLGPKSPNHGQTWAPNPWVSNRSW